MPSHLNLEELVQETRVHRRIYLEPQIFDLEMERIFETNWVFVGHHVSGRRALCESSGADCLG